MKKIIKFLFILFINIFILGCATLYDFNFIPNKEQSIEMNLYLPPAYSYLQIIIYLNIDKPITNFEYIDGFVQIGDIKIDFNKDLIHILGKEKETNFNITMSNKGNENSLKDENNLLRYDQYLNKNNDFFYYFEFIRFFEENIKKEIIKKKNLYNVLVNLNCRMTINDEVIDIIFNEGFLLEVEKQKVSIFDMSF